MSCISFKGTQYKEVRFVRDLFKEMDTEYYPKSIVVPVSYTFHAYIDISLPKQSETQQSLTRIDLTK